MSTLHDLNAWAKTHGSTDSAYYLAARRSYRRQRVRDVARLGLVALVAGVVGGLTALAGWALLGAR